MNNKRIIIVDDEESVLKNLAAFFEDEDYEVVTASTGEKALDLISEKGIDLAIVDIRLPGIDGNTVIIKAREVRPSMKFVIHTGSSDYVIPEELIRLGIRSDMVFFKPITDLNLLRDALENAAGI